MNVNSVHIIDLSRPESVTPDALGKALNTLANLKEDKVTSLFCSNKGLQFNSNVIDERASTSLQVCQDLTKIISLAGNNPKYAKQIEHVRKLRDNLIPKLPTGPDKKDETRRVLWDVVTSTERVSDKVMNKLIDVVDREFLAKQTPDSLQVFKSSLENKSEVEWRRAPPHGTTIWSIPSIIFSKLFSTEGSRVSDLINLTDEAIEEGGIRSLPREEIQGLDASKLSFKQLKEIGFENLSENQKINIDYSKFSKEEIKFIINNNGIKPFINATRIPDHILDVADMERIGLEEFSPAQIQLKLKELKPEEILKLSKETIQMLDPDVLVGKLGTDNSPSSHYEFLGKNLSDEQKKMIDLTQVNNFSVLEAIGLDKLSSTQIGSLRPEQIPDEKLKELQKISEKWSYGQVLDFWKIASSTLKLELLKVEQIKQIPARRYLTLEMINEMGVNCFSSGQINSFLEDDLKYELLNGAQLYGIHPSLTRFGEDALLNKFSDEQLRRLNVDNWPKVDYVNALVRKTPFIDTDELHRLLLTIPENDLSKLSKDAIRKLDIERLNENQRRKIGLI